VTDLTGDYLQHQDCMLEEEFQLRTNSQLAFNAFATFYLTWHTIGTKRTLWVGRLSGRAVDIADGRVWSNTLWTEVRV
jgi:hypothetical protein